MSGTYHLVDNDKIPKSNLIGIIDVLNVLIKWLNQPQFHDYLMYRMGKAYEAYKQTQEQIKYYGDKLAKASQE
jgi:hypothetical protein